MGKNRSRQNPRHEVAQGFQHRRRHLGNVLADLIRERTNAVLALLGLRMWDRYISGCGSNWLMKKARRFSL